MNATFPPFRSSLLELGMHLLDIHATLWRSVFLLCFSALGPCYDISQVGITADELYYSRNVACIGCGSSRPLSTHPHLPSSTGFVQPPPQQQPRTNSSHLRVDTFLNPRHSSPSTTEPMTLYQTSGLSAMHAQQRPALSPRFSSNSYSQANSPQAPNFIGLSRPPPSMTSQPPAPGAPAHPILTPSGRSFSRGGRVQNVSSDPLVPCVMYWPDNEALPERGQIRPSAVVGSAVSFISCFTASFPGRNGAPVPL